jgi:hypothetical protein
VDQDKAWRLTPADGYISKNSGAAGGETAAVDKDEMNGSGGSIRSMDSAGTESKITNEADRMARAKKRKSRFLFGPRQTGKTSLIRNTLAKHQYYNLLQTDVYLKLSRAPQRLCQEITDGETILEDTPRKAGDIAITYGLEN